MAFEHNTQNIKSGVALAGRDISARRAATIANMIAEAEKRGIDDAFARDAIGKYGADNAEAFRATMKDADDFSEFADNFGTDHNKEIFEMEILEKTDEKLSIDFHYYPYVTEWVKQGYSPEEIAHLCDITMEGDREFAKKFPNLKFELQGTIADGLPVCKLRFKNKIITGGA